jgi:hypothetical protein
MTRLLERAMQAAQSLPPEMQDDIARMMLLYAGEDQPPVDLTSEEEAAVLRSREAAARGEFATDEQVRAIWAKHGL